jgi:hypothetical protein
MTSAGTEGNAFYDSGTSTAKQSDNALRDG